MFETQHVRLLALHLTASSDVLLWLTLGGCGQLPAAVPVMLRRTTTSTGFVPELRQRRRSLAQKPVVSSLTEPPPSLHSVAPEQLPYFIRAPIFHVAYRWSTRPPRLVCYIHRGAMSSSNSDQEFRFSGRPLLLCFFYALDNVFTHCSWRNVEAVSHTLAGVSMSLH